MILKEMDSKKDLLDYLRYRFSNTKNKNIKQKILHEVVMIKNGSNAEKGNAYYLDFDLKDSKHFIVLHDIRIEYNGRTAQIDHILISRGGIHILESKSVKNGTLKINKDDSIEIQYNKYKKVTLPSPIEQNRRHKRVIHDFIKDKVELPWNIRLFGGVEIETLVLIHPNTNVYNYILPNGYIKADQFIKKYHSDVDKETPVAMFKFVSKFLTKESRVKIAEALISSHTPIDYAAKMRDENIQNVKQCPRCKIGTLEKKSIKNKKYIGRYENDDFFGCSTYPKCRYTSALKWENKISLF